MAIQRDSRTPIINGGLQLGTSDSISLIKENVDSGVIDTDVKIFKEAERLDILAGKIYGDSRNWWIIAAASGIGWGLQVPPGIRILIPKDLEQIASIIG